MAAKKKSRCPSTVPALTKALDRAKAHAKVETAKKKAASKVVALLKKKAVSKQHSVFERAAKKLTAIWEEPKKRTPKLAYNAVGEPITWHGKHLTVAEVNRRLRG